MEYDVMPDVPFLADALVGLARLDARQFREDPKLAREVLRRFIAKDYVWVEERPDSWSDAKTLGDPNKKEFDCEDFAAAFAALIALVYGDARTAIRRVGERQCHAITGRGDVVYDICPRFKMPGISSGPAEWRELKEEPMIAELGTLLVAGVKRLMGETIEPMPDLPSDMETGSPAQNLAASLIPPVAAARMDHLENQLNARTRERDAARKSASILLKERDALKKGLLETETKVKRIVVERETAKVKGEDALRQVEDGKGRMASLSRQAVEAEAFLKACKEQVTALLAKTNDEGVKVLAQEALTRIEAEKPEDIANSFDDFETRELLWDTVATGAAHLTSLPCCASCGRGEACDGPDCPESHRAAVGSAGGAETALVGGLDPMWGWSDFERGNDTSGCLPCQL